MRHALDGATLSLHPVASRRVACPLSSKTLTISLVFVSSTFRDASPETVRFGDSTVSNFSWHKPTIFVMPASPMRSRYRTSGRPASLLTGILEMDAMRSATRELGNGGSRDAGDRVSEGEESCAGSRRLPCNSTNIVYGEQRLSFRQRSGRNAPSVLRFRCS